jgi:LysM repeat protein
MRINSSGPSLQIAIIVIIVAIILAFGLFLAILFVQNRPATNTSQVVVEGVTVTLHTDPNEVVIIVEGQGQGGELPPEQATPAPPPDTPIPPPTATPIPPPVVDQVIFVNHTVSANDTLYNLTNRYNTTIALMARYGISAANLISGQVITIAVANPAYCPGMRAYVVRESDTPGGIARSAGITVEQFWQMNNMDANSPLRFTDVVCLP